MFKKIGDKIQDAYLKAAQFVREIKTDEQGLSGVVVAILLILIAVLAVALIWGFLSGWLKELWGRISTTEF